MTDADGAPADSGAGDNVADSRMADRSMADRSVVDSRDADGVADHSAADILVAGGGPVGLATAIEARLAGFSVIVIEPRSTPIDKACGEGLMPGAVVALRRLGVEPSGQPLAGVAYIDARLRAEHRFRAGTALGVRRTALHAAMALRAEELGVRWIVGKVAEVEQGGQGVRVGIRGIGGTAHGGEMRPVSGSVRPDGGDIRPVTGDVRPVIGTVRPVTGSWLIGCDGLHSTVRRLVGLEGGAQSAGRRRFGLRGHFRVAPWSDLIEVYWTPAIEAYVTPVGPETVGVAILGPRRADYARALAAVPGLGDRLAGAERVTSIIGAGPMRQSSVRRAAGRVLLAGDASGYVDALTGEGLRLGFDQARAAVQSIGAAVGSGAVGSGAGQRVGTRAPGANPAAADPGAVARRYERAWRQSTRDFRVITGGLVAAGRSPLRGRIVAASMASPRLFGAIVERLAR